MIPAHPTSVLFVCLGNICRSPLAEGVFRQKIQEAGLGDQFLLDSAGLGAWHVGHPPDGRTISVARVHGTDISDLRARRIAVEDFYAFDLILAMDRDNLRDIRAMQPRDGTAEVALYLEYCGLEQMKRSYEVPDPYYGGADVFEDVYHLVDQASDILLQKLR
ncbi:low molecular weight protein-tyrosine-phosphatase [uncultured Cohaesibacter sp.]|uniref:low molecular weight protein-tyrosine-phosphatase n=1 Tax=uncultured Cohaesibacter sp. TaxID=1002546 RepID=UPI002AAB67F0|nr:low molecular weight protein-tyrosine-phosphatase [uncultured Cohaesibacter sp.]